MAYRPKGFPNVGTLFILKNVLYGTTDNVTHSNATTGPSTLFDGSVGIYVVTGNNEASATSIVDGALVVAGATAAQIEGINQFYFATNTPDGVLTSPIFDRRNFSWRYRDAAASVAQVVTASPVISAAPADDDNYKITIIDTTEGIEDLKRISFDFTGKDLSAATTAAVVNKYAAIITAYIASAHADANFPLATAANSGSDTLVLTAKTGFSFRVALDEINAGDTIAYTTPYNPGSGQPAQVQQIESDLWAASGGYVNRVLDYGRAPVSRVNTALSGTSAYDLLTLRWLNSRKSTGWVQTSESIPNDMVIAIPSTVTPNGNEAGLKALLSIFDYTV
jgi:hypothetical protein